MIRSLATQTARRRGGKEIRRIHHQHNVSYAKSGTSVDRMNMRCRFCCRSFSSTTTKITSSLSSTPTAPTTSLESMMLTSNRHSSSSSTAASTLAIATALLVAIGNDSSSTTALAEEAGGSTGEDEMYADWDDFMIKSISPGEDDDEDDDDEDDDEDEDEEEEEEENEDEDDSATSGPADETEDVTNGNNAEEIQIIEANDAPAQEEDDPNDTDPISSSFSTEGEQPQGPADVDEDSGMGYEAQSSEEEEKDMYEHLENDDVEDEPTTCTICLINRQGPCRPLWRKFEHCMKDHGSGSEQDDKKNNGEKSEESSAEGGGPSPTLAQMCDRYMLPWLNCIQSHRNTYTLITNGFYKDEFVDPMELSVKEEDKVLFADGVGTGDEKQNSIDVDLTHWWEYAEAQREQEDGDVLIVNDEEDEEQQILEDVVEKATQEAKEFLEEKEGDADQDATTVSTVATSEDPFLVNVYAKFNLREPTTDRLIDIAYIRDQDGRLLGFDQFSKEKTSATTPTGKNEKDGVDNDSTGNDTSSEVNVEDEKDDGGGKTGNCMFHIKPGETKSIQLFAIYREGSKENKGEVDDEDMSSTTKVEETLYYSAPISLGRRVGQNEE